MSSHRWSPRIVTIALMAPPVLYLLIVGGWARWHFGPAAAAAYLRGETLHIEPKVNELGEVCPGETRRVAVKVTNLTARPITILGVRQFCGDAGCVSCPEETPFQLSPTSTRDVSFGIVAPESTAVPVALETHIFTSIGNPAIRFTGRVVGSLGLDRDPSPDQEHPR